MGNIHQTFIGELQFRNHGQGHKREGKKGVFQEHADFPGSLSQFFHLGSNPLGSIQRYEPAHWQGERGFDLFLIHDHKPTLHLFNLLHRLLHFLIGDANDHKVVGVVSDRSGQRPSFQAESLHQAKADIPGSLMPLDDRDLQDIRFRVRDNHSLVIFFDGQAKFPGEDLIGEEADDPGFLSFQV